MFSLCLHQGLPVACFLYAYTMASQYIVFFMPTPWPHNILFSLCLHQDLPVSCFLYAYTRASQYLVFLMPTPGPPSILFSLCLHQGLPVWQVRGQVLRGRSGDRLCHARQRFELSVHIFSLFYINNIIIVLLILY